MKALGVLISILWVISGILLVLNKQFIPEIVIITTLTIVALFLTYRRKELIKSHCHCAFGGLIICIVLGFSMEVKELSFNNVLSMLILSGLISLPLVISDTNSRINLFSFWGESRVPFSLQGKKPEDLGIGCLTFIIQYGIRILAVFVLGFLSTLILYFMALQELYSNAELPFKRVITNISRESSTPENYKLYDHKTEKSIRKQSNKTIHWL